MPKPKKKPVAVAHEETLSEVKEIKFRRPPTRAARASKSDAVSEDDLAQMAEDGEDKKEVAPDKLELIVKLSREQVDLEAEIAAIQEKLAEAQKKHKAVSQGALPALLLELGMSNFDLLQEGVKVVLDIEHHGSIKADKVKEAYEHLAANKMGGAIRRNISIEFLLADEKLVKKFIEYLQKNFKDRVIKDKTAINPQTLKAWIRSQKAAKKELPDCFGVHTITQTIIERPKAPKPVDASISGAPETF